MGGAAGHGHGAVSGRPVRAPNTPHMSGGQRFPLRRFEIAARRDDATSCVGPARSGPARRVVLTGVHDAMERPSRWEAIRCRDLAQDGAEPCVPD